MARDSYNDGVSSAHNSDREKRDAVKMKNVAEERATRRGNELESIRIERNNLKDLLRDPGVQEKSMKKEIESLKKEVELLMRQKDNVMEEHKREVSALKKLFPT